MAETTYADLDLQRGLAMTDDKASPTAKLIRHLLARVSSMSSMHDEKIGWFDRFDALYFPTRFTDWGADIWPDDPSATTPGRAHISINRGKIAVDLPAALQAYEPVENMLAKEDSPASRSAAQAMENLRAAWKYDEQWTLKRHKAAVIKGLYGETASFVYHDKEKGYPCADIIQNPRNLWIGYRSDDYEKVEWAAHATMRSPESIMADYSVDITVRQPERDVIVPWVMPEGDVSAHEPRPTLTYGPSRIEVWDYWYLLPSEKKGKRGEPTKMVTWNVVIAGNSIVAGPYEYPEYEGVIPYKPLYNTFIPGTPAGRSELHDAEQLIHEMTTRVTAGAQMIKTGTDGQYWQITGPDAPSRPPAGAKPKLNELVAPGAGNRIEAITPFIAQFQLEQHLGRIDREWAAITGLNDLIMGLAPTQALSSSKAINALISQYEARLSMSRLLFFTWDKETWELLVKVWAYHDKTVKKIVDAGGGVLDIIDPSLSPRDEMETATRAANLVNAKLWSQARGMDAVGVDDPEQEQNIIREESTDASLWPDRVTMMAQLLVTLQGAGIAPQPGATEQASGQAAALQSALGAATPESTEGSQLEGDQGITPEVAGGEASPFAQGPAGAEQGIQLQGMVTGGESSTRLMTQTDLRRRGG